PVAGAVVLCPDFDQGRPSPHLTLSTKSSTIGRRPFFDRALRISRYSVLSRAELPGQTCRSLRNFGLTADAFELLARRSRFRCGATATSCCFGAASLF